MNTVHKEFETNTNYLSSTLDTASSFQNLSPNKSSLTSEHSVYLVKQLSQLQNKGVQPVDAGFSASERSALTASSTSYNPVAYMIQQNNKNSQFQEFAASNRKVTQQLNLMMTAIKSGNLTLAMIILSSLESKDAAKMNEMLAKQLTDARDNRKKVSDSIAKALGKKDSKEEQKLTNQMNEVNDTIQLITSLIKDVNDQKNRTIEFANNFNANEHQIDMDIVRGMRG